MRAFREHQIDDAAEQEGESGDNEAQCQPGDEMEVQRPAPEDVGVRTLLTSSRLPEVPQQTDRSNHRKGKTVKCVLCGPARPRTELLGEEKVTDAEERRHGASEEKTNARERRQVVVELTEDESGSARWPPCFLGSWIQRYQPRVCSSSSSASFATSRPRIGSPSPRETFARMSGSW